MISEKKNLHMFNFFLRLPFATFKQIRQMKIKVSILRIKNMFLFLRRSNTPLVHFVLVRYLWSAGCSYNSVDFSNCLCMSLSIGINVRSTCSSSSSSSSIGHFTRCSHLFCNITFTSPSKWPKRWIKIHTLSDIVSSQNMLDIMISCVRIWLKFYVKHIILYRLFRDFPIFVSPSVPFRFPSISPCFSFFL